VDYRAEFRPDIQAVRALAVALVVLYHANIPGVHGGFLGVDVFFVVSGFVITNVLLRERASRGTTSIPGFYARRIRRILPAATVVLIATVFATYHWLSFISGGANADDAKYVAAFIGNFHFASLGTGPCCSCFSRCPGGLFQSLRGSFARYRSSSQPPSRGALLKLAKMKCGPSFRLSPGRGSWHLEHSSRSLARTYGDDRPASVW
jgi:hypothetical protein